MEGARLEEVEGRACSPPLKSIPLTMREEETKRAGKGVETQVMRATGRGHGKNTMKARRLLAESAPPLCKAWTWHPCRRENGHGMRCTAPLTWTCRGQRKEEQVDHLVRRAVMDPQDVAAEVAGVGAAVQTGVEGGPAQAPTPGEGPCGGAVDDRTARA